MYSPKTCGPKRSSSVRILSRVFPEVNDDSIFKKIAPLRIDALQGYIVFESLAVTFEDGTKYFRKREDRGSKIEAESFGLQLIELAADLRVLLKDGDLEASAAPA